VADRLDSWYVFAAYWLIAWLPVKGTKTTKTFARRLTTILPMVLGFELLFSRSLAIRPLRLRFVPAETWIGWSGIALTRFPKKPVYGPPRLFPAQPPHCR
jgi:hypothetical protein